MRLSLQSDYALRLLMMLATNPERLCTISDVSTTYGISRNHLMKVTNLLVREGFVESVRGRAGGLRLARPAQQIGIGAVVRLTEGDLALLDCLQAEDNSACHVSSVCRLKSALRQATQAFMSVLDGFTLADVVAGNAALADMLIPPSRIETTQIH